MKLIKMASPNFFEDYSPIQGVVLHGTSGNLQSSLSWLCSRGSEVSSNYVISKTGVIYELVDFKAGRRAWANGIVENYDHSIKWLYNAVKNGINPNRITVSIEHEASKREMETRASMTDAQFNASIDLTAFILKSANLSASNQTVIGHYQISGTNKFNCPGVIFPPAYVEVLIQRYSELG